MQEIKLAIIGAGRMGITHYSIINSHPDVEMVSVAEPAAMVLSLMGKYLAVKTFRDYHLLFEQTHPDAILVCTPPNMHFEIIREAGLRGIHVFAEKPFTTKYSEASELSGLFNEKKLVNQVGYVNRFNDVFCKVKEFLSKGLIGKVIRFKSEMFCCTVMHKDEGSGWRASHDSGGGAVYEMASHAIDLVNFLIGKPDKVVGSSLNHIYSKNVEDAVSTTLLYKDDVSGTLYINWSDTSYRKPCNKLEIFGEGGRIMADQYSAKIYMNKPNDQYKLHQGWNTLYITDVFKPVPFYVRGNEFTRQLYHFVNCINNRAIPNQCTFSDGANALSVIGDIFTDYELNGRI